MTHQPFVASTALLRTPPLACLPGWGFSAQLLNPLRSLNHCFFLGDNWIDRDKVFKALLGWLEDQKRPQMTLLGWSLGAYRALEFAQRHPQLVSRVVLVSLRPQFPAEEIARERASLLADPVGHLRGFYRRAFAGQSEDRRRFARTQLDAHLGDLSVDKVADLATLLEELGQARITPAQLNRHDVHLIHGNRDLIAPRGEVEGFVPAERLTLLDRVGHVPPYAQGFLDCVRGLLP